MKLLYLSDLLKKPVTDSTGKKIGKLKDIIVSPESSHPLIKSIIVLMSDKKTIDIPHTYINELGKEIKLKSTLKDIPKYKIKKSDIKIREDVLDRQVLDIEDKKVKRVNDIKLSSNHGYHQVIGIDNGFYGVLKRFRLAIIAKLLGVKANNNIIAWENVDTLDKEYSTLKLKVSKEKMKKLHSADIAEIMDQVGVNESLNIFNSLDDETAADTLKDVLPERQVSLLDNMDSQRAAEILDSMHPDHAADAIGDSSKEKAEELLDLMKTQKSDNIKKLLEYPKNSAGGIMTTEYAHVDQDLTGRQVMKTLRKIAKDAETIYYVYITSKNGELVGVASLRDILIADPDEKISDFMETNIIKVDILENRKKVAAKIVKYNLLVIPVIENKTKLMGIITINDVEDIISPVIRKRKVPGMFGS